MRTDLFFKAASGMQTYATSLKMTRITENYFGIHACVRSSAMAEGPYFSCYII